MTFLLWILSGPFCGYLGYLLGVRREKGRMELEADAAEAEAYRRSERPGSVVMTTMKIRR